METRKLRHTLTDVGIHAWWYLLYVLPIKKLRGRFVTECFPVSFDSEQEYLEAEHLPVGAVLDVHWAHDLRPGPDGKRLFVQLHNGPWFVDGRASNCTRPDDSEHYCWVRTGSVEDGTLYVHKRGRTCDAGAGSVRSSGYHARWSKQESRKLGLRFLFP